MHGENPQHPASWVTCQAAHRASVGPRQRKSFQSLVARLNILTIRGVDVNGPPRAVITAALAHAVWPKEPALGRRLAIDMYNGITPEVIAVIDDVHLTDARTPVRPLAFLSDSEFPDTERDLVVRTSGSPESVVPSIRAVVHEIEPGLPLYRVSPLSQLVDRSLDSDRFTTFLLSAFAGVALILAAIGIFGVFSTDIARRRKEIALRLALGGSAAGVIVLLVGQALRRAAVGIFAGLALAYGLARVMNVLLFGIGADDPVSMLVVTGGILVLTLGATAIPAAKALRSSPLSALRDE